MDDEPNDTDSGRAPDGDPTAPDGLGRDPAPDPAHNADAAAGAPPPGVPSLEPHMEAVWTFRGYQLRSSEFNTAMVHFFRAEISRANTWRLRLDATTNWAVITTGAAISFAFRSDILADHGVIILNTLLVTLFLYIEARRYRYYELWSYRVRLMETDYYAAMLVPPFRPAADWAETLAENLLSPKFPISMLEALGRRFRRNYLWIYVLLGIAWLAKISLHPTPAESWSVVIDRAEIGGIPGWLVVGAGIVYNSVLMLLGLLTVGLKRATGEVLPRYDTARGREMLAEVLHRQAPAKSRFLPRFRPSRRREEMLAFIITDQPEAIARRVLEEMHRGVTEIEGRGMYTGERHSVLMSAITVTEVRQFQALANEADPRAFVIVSPALEVKGSGFAPLDAEREKAGRL